MYNLQKGFDKIKHTKSKDTIEIFKLSLQAILKVGETQMYRYINGTTEMKANQLFAVLDLFEKHGVKREEMR